jgi:DEAD/DEAH box helicase domain-containing protein
LVAGEDQLDQWLMAHPGEVFTRSPEPAIVNPANPFVLLPHLACAAYEQPLTDADEEYWGDALDDAVRRLVLEGRLRVSGRRAFYAGGGPPAPSVGLRTGTSGEYRIVDGGDRLVGTVDEARAFETVHPGAVYLHQGQHYRVDDLDLHDRVARVSRASGDEMTETYRDIDVAIVAEDGRQRVGPAVLAVGDVEVAEQVTGYRRRNVFTRKTLGRHPLDLPPTRLRTRAFWYTFEDEDLADAGLTPDRVPGTVHAAEHAGIGILPLFTICDRNDVGGVSMARHPQTGKATIVIYDGYPGGAGIAELGFEAGGRHLEATLEVVRSCPCRAGCPSCVQSPKCGNGNEPLDKQGAVSLLQTLLA